MSIESLISMFEQYGWPGIIAIVCILIVYYFISKKDKKAIDTINAGFVGMATTMSQQNETLISAITTANENSQNRLFELVTKALDKKDSESDSRHRNALKKRAEISAQIDSILFGLLQHTHAQRTFVIEFHNSKCNLDGLSFLWYDMQYEKQQKGITAMSPNVKSVQAGSIYPIVKRVNREKTHIVEIGPEDIDKIYNESTVLYSQYKNADISHIIYSGIYNTDTNELIGFVGVEYHNGYIYNEDFVDRFMLKEKTVLIENLYNNARKEVYA